VTTNDTTPHPPGEPEELGQLFAEVFDLVEAEVDAIPDDHVNDRLQQLLWENGYVDPDEHALDQIGIADSLRGETTDLADLIKVVHVVNEVDEATCMLRAVQEEVAQAEARAHAVREEADRFRNDVREMAARMMGEASRAREHAEGIRAGVDAYVDAELDRAADIIADAQARAAQIIADAEQQAETVTAAAQARADRRRPVAEESGARPFHVWFAGDTESVNRLRSATGDEASLSAELSTPPRDGGVFVFDIAPLLMPKHTRQATIDTVLLLPGSLLDGGTHEHLVKPTWAHQILTTDRAACGDLARVSHRHGFIRRALASVFSPLTLYTADTFWAEDLANVDGGEFSALGGIVARDWVFPHVGGDRFGLTWYPSGSVRFSTEIRPGDNLVLACDAAADAIDDDTAHHATLADVAEALDAAGWSCPSFRPAKCVHNHDVVPDDEVHESRLALGSADHHG
jgi:hypothetical protein